MIFLLKTFIYRFSIVKLTKLSKFEFEVRFLKNQKNYKNSSSSKFDQIRYSVRSNRIVKNVKIMQKFGYGTVELFPQKYGTVRYGTKYEKSSRVSLYLVTKSKIFKKDRVSGE